MSRAYIGKRVDVVLQVDGIPSNEACMECFDIKACAECLDSKTPIRMLFAGNGVLLEKAVCPAC